MKITKKMFDKEEQIKKPQKCKRKTKNKLKQQIEKIQTNKDKIRTNNKN